MNENKTIGELKGMPCGDGWGHIPTIEENKKMKKGEKRKC